MTKVFFSGSRRFRTLNQAVRERADNIVAKGLTVLVGDADGADRLMQEYLAEKRYGNVVVYCTGNVCRNNVGRWPTRHIKPEGTARGGFQYYALKDSKMSKEATCGFVMWDGKSKGSLNNIINLLGQGKKVLVYFAPAAVCSQLTTHRDLASLLGSNGDRDLAGLERQLRLKTGQNRRGKQLTFA